MLTAADVPAQFTLVIAASDSSINGLAVVDTNNNEIDIEGVLQPNLGNGDPTVFYFDSATGHLATNSTLTGAERFGYTLYSNFTSSLRFNDGDNISGDVGYPTFTVGDDGLLSAGGNLTWAWCPDDFNVGDGWYLPGSVTLGSIAKGCEKIDGLTAVAASS
jgi:hypothetical protein